MRAAELLVLGVVAMLVLLLVVRPLLGRLLEVDISEESVEGDHRHAARRHVLAAGPDRPRRRAGPAPGRVTRRPTVATRVDAR